MTGQESGISHPALAVVDVGNHDATDLRPNYGSVQEFADASDPLQHGTEIASIIAAAGNNNDGATGMLWQAKISLYNVAKTPPPVAHVAYGAVWPYNLARAAKDGARVVPVVVCGDRNDVAWSRTTRLFQKTSRLVDPRKGRGLFSTFHARIPLLRFPLDHILHSDDFRLVSMRRLEYVGSDHFPVYAMLSFEPSAKHHQEAPTADSGDKQEAQQTIAEGVSKA